MNLLSKNWKTTIAGIIAIIIQVGPIIWPRYITPSVANTISTIAAALGLIAAKDSNVTSDTVKE